MESHDLGLPRYEVKMVCAEIYLPDVRSWVRWHPDAFAEAYPPRRVNNLYFDTYEADCVSDNLVGVSERAKVRLRWYGTDHSAVRGMLELKHKLNQVGWKERCPVPETLDLTTISWAELRQCLVGYAEGILSVWLAHADQPVLINSYTREYYESADRQVRLTVDSDQVVYAQVTYTAPNLLSRSVVESQIVIEVKAGVALHRRVSNVLSSFPLRTERHSKYVSGVLDSLSFL
ncbi:MAG: VTC domain-containing protein [Anaerolineae bacterium]|nr:VTC domain-containing protein [Anaerolineae bacterium]